MGGSIMLVSYFLCPQSLRVSSGSCLCISYGGYSWDSHKKKTHHLVYASINKQWKGLCLESKVQTLLDSVKWDDKGLAVAVAQNFDTGAILMQGFANRDAVTTTISSRKVEGNKLALSTLYSLGSTISQRKAELEAEQNGKPSSTKRLLLDNKLLCSKIREEADELYRTLEENEEIFSVRCRRKERSNISRLVLTERYRIKFFPVYRGCWSN
nr:histidine biosynthesis bifunctional protein hisie, chloroplastic [Quercus suber]